MAQQQFLRNGRWVPFAEMQRIRAKEVAAMKETGIDPKQVVMEATGTKAELTGYTTPSNESVTLTVDKPEKAPKAKTVKTKGKK